MVILTSQPVARTPARSASILAVVCGAAFTINLATTAVNIALPTLSRELTASTQQLQWIVDAYNLVFATFVLAAGSLSDRFGRKGAMQVGLVIFGTAATGASFATSPAQLIAGQAVMGMGAAVIFPTTLSIISNVYVQRAQRARAIGLWGAVTGVGVASGPIMAGWLIEHAAWPGIYLCMAGLAGLTIVAVSGVVVTSRDPVTPRLDRLGLLLSVLAMATLVYTIIEAPTRGWARLPTLGGFAVAVALLVLFLGWERQRSAPMVDLGLLRNPRFTAASGAITAAFFALFGFIFVITQYFQLLHGYGPLSTGLRITPVAVSIAVGSVAGTALAVRIGNKMIVAVGLLLLGAAFAWVAAVVTVSTAYSTMAEQMILMGLGVGATAVPATEAIMGAVPKEKAGIGSAMNDATRELGGTLGVAVVGSVFASVYATTLATASIAQQLPPQALATARSSMTAALAIANRMPDGPAAQVVTAANHAFLRGLTAGSFVAAGVALAGALLAAVFLPARPMPVPPDGPTVGVDRTQDLQLTGDRGADGSGAP
jgi:EmrB/QacA subfamily drug resistance transporter